MFAYHLEHNNPHAPKASESEVRLGTASFADVAITLPPYAKLTPSELYTMANRQANLSRAYQHGELRPSSEVTFELGKGEFREGRMLLADLMTRFEETLVSDECFACLFSTKPDEVEAFREAFRQRLEDPGFLTHVMYYGSAADPDWLCFYWDLWLMGGSHLDAFFRGKVWSPDGKYHLASTESSWGRFCLLEGMALAVRGLDLLRTAFTSSLVCDQQLEGNRTISAATNSDYVVSLIGFTRDHTQDELSSILLSAARQLKHRGVILFDLSVKNPSLRRLTRTVGLASKPGVNPYHTAGKALKAARHLATSLNSRLRTDAVANGKTNDTVPYLDLELTRVLSYGPWGDVVVAVALRKYEV